MILQYLVIALEYCIEFAELRINIAYDFRSLPKVKLHGMTELQMEFAKFWNKAAEFTLCLYYLYMSYTDILCYSVFVLTVLISPTIFNVFFTFSAFAYAAIQFPTPHKVFILQPSMQTHYNFAALLATCFHCLRSDNWPFIHYVFDTNVIRW